MNAVAVGVLDKTTELINHGAHRSSSSYDLPAGSAASSFIAQPRRERLVGRTRVKRRTMAPWFLSDYHYYFCSLILDRSATKPATFSPAD